jgi:hypothetical protein
MMMKYNHKIENWIMKKTVSDIYVTMINSNVTLTCLENSRLDDAVDIQRKQLHTLWKNKLAGRRWTSTIFSVTSKNLRTLLNKVFTNLART